MFFRVLWQQGNVDGKESEHVGGRGIENAVCWLQPDNFMSLRRSISKIRKRYFWYKICSGFINDNKSFKHFQGDFYRLSKEWHQASLLTCKSLWETSHLQFSIILRICAPGVYFSWITITTSPWGYTKLVFEATENSYKGINVKVPFVMQTITKRAKKFDCRLQHVEDSF